jgi:hypothetical protein
MPDYTDLIKYDEDRDDDDDRDHDHDGILDDRNLTHHVRKLTVESYWCRKRWVL